MQIYERDAGETARSYAYRVIKNNIEDLSLYPGQSVSENELASMLGLSRTPVREALIELSKLNLVLIRPQAGTIVTKIDYHIIDSVSFARVAMECAALTLACRNGICDGYLDLLHQNTQEHSSIPVKKENIRLLLDTDNRFHYLLFEAVGKQEAYDYLKERMTHLNRLRIIKFEVIGYDRIIRDHENIVYAMEHHDEELGRMIMSRHLYRYQLEKNDLSSVYPGYFL